MDELKNKKLLLIAVIVILGYAVFAATQNWWPFGAQEQGSPSTSLGTTGDTASWQTYRNQEFGFEVKYPGSFTLLKEDNYINLESQSAIELVLSKPVSYTDGEVVISINVNGNSRFLFSDSFPSLKYADRLILSEEKTSFVFETPITLRIYTGIADERKYIITEYPELVKRDEQGNYYLFYAVLLPEDTEAEKEFNQILSTFRFIE